MLWGRSIIKRLLGDTDNTPVPVADSVGSGDKFLMLQDGELKRATGSMMGGGSLVDLFNGNLTTYPVGFADDDRIFHLSKALILSGAGTPEADGELTVRGYVNAKRIYYGLEVNSGSDGFSVLWQSDTSRWEVYDSNVNLAYISNDDVETPDLAVFTTNEETSGVLPAPAMQLVKRAYSSTISEIRTQLFLNPAFSGAGSFHSLVGTSLNVGGSIKAAAGDTPKLKVSSAPSFDVNDEGQAGAFFVWNVGGGIYHLKFRYKLDSGTPLEIDLGAMA